MFCPKCGKEINDDAIVCVHCGRGIKAKKSESDFTEPKTGIGVVMGMFLGLIGLIIGICMYPEGTVARKTFMKGWLISFFTVLGVAAVIMIIVFACFGSMIGSVMQY